jgi:hypothetical protein
MKKTRFTSLPEKKSGLERGFLFLMKNIQPSGTTGAISKTGNREWNGA